MTAYELTPGQIARAQAVAARLTDLLLDQMDDEVAEIGEVDALDEQRAEAEADALLEVMAAELRRNLSPTPGGE